MAYFDLKYMRTYITSGVGGLQGTKYYFEKGKPTFAKDEADATLFRGQPEIFVEVDENGTPVTHETVTTENRTYKRFRAQNILPEDAEALLNKVHEDAEANPRTVDVNELLKAANEDTVVPAEVKEVKKISEVVEQQSSENLGTITSDDLPKRPTGSAKAKKLAANTCHKCNRKFKNKEELEKHLLDHEDEG